MNFHQKALLIGAVTLSLCVGVFVWIVVLDKGTLQVVGNPPYQISVEGTRIKGAKTQVCTSDPCLLSLPRGTYTATITKEGYFEEVRTVEIVRGQPTDVAIDFVYIPAVKEVTEMNGLERVLAPPVDLSEDFSFTFDETYQKQRLDYTDPETSEVTVWAYFDRPLEDPLIFPASTLDRVAVVDRAPGENFRLYLVRWVEWAGEEPHFSRELLGTVPQNDQTNVVGGLWSPVGPTGWGGDHFLLQTMESDTLSNTIFSIGGVFTFDWPMDLPLNKMAWNTTGQLLFLSRQDLSSLEGQTLDADSSSWDVLEAILSGELSEEPAAFFIVKLHLEEVYGGLIHRTIYEVSSDLGLDYFATSLFYDPLTDKAYFSDGEKVFEVIQEE